MNNFHELELHIQSQALREKFGGNKSLQDTLENLSILYHSQADFLRFIGDQQLGIKNVGSETFGRLMGAHEACSIDKKGLYTSMGVEKPEDAYFDIDDNPTKKLLGKLEAYLYFMTDHGQKHLATTGLKENFMKKIETALNEKYFPKK